MDAAVRDMVYNVPRSFPELVARNTTSSPSAADEKPPSYKLIGLALAVGSGLFIGVSFVLKKYGLLKANVKYNEEAGEGYGYLKNFYWWGGMTLMILGEICNFAAYLFADAILVTPLGALSVVICAILSSIFLKERLSFVGKMGCFSCIIGSIVIACNAPEQAAVSTIQEMKKLMLSAPFLAYGCTIIVGCAIVAIWVAPKYGKKSMLVYLSVCSLIGGLSVVCIQGLGAAVTAQARGIPQFNQWFLYFVLVFVIATLVTEIIYLNKALNLYNAALVTPTYYVYFTSATIVSDAILYRGFKGSAIQIITVVLGFLQICSGVVLLQLSKSAKDVPDSAVFSGDVDQVRVLAEQEEPEYEPRADTMRGTAALIRSMSQVRHKRETKDMARIKEEHMAPIGENEEVEWDGLRRRRTVSGPLTPSMRGSGSKRRTLHPPLGMSRFPDEEEEEEDHDRDNGMHPGFWSHLRRKPVRDSAGSVAMGHLSNSGSATAHDDPPRTPASPNNSSRSSHIFGLPAALRRPVNLNESPPLPPPHGDFETLKDTSYQGAGATIETPRRISSHHVQWSDANPQTRQLTGMRSRGNTTDSESDPSQHFLSAGPPHISLEDIPQDAADAAARRQFSFSSIFNRAARDGAGSGRGGHSPTTGTGLLGSLRSASTPSQTKLGQPSNSSRTGLSFSRRGIAGQVSSATEEERAGLVRGDASFSGLPGTSSPPRYDSSLSSSPVKPNSEPRTFPSRGDSLSYGSNPQSASSSPTARRQQQQQQQQYTLPQVPQEHDDDYDSTLLREPQMPITRLSALRTSQADSDTGNRSDAESIQVHLHPALAGGAAGGAGASATSLTAASVGERPRRPIGGAEEEEGEDGGLVTEQAFV